MVKKHFIIILHVILVLSIFSCSKTNRNKRVDRIISLSPSLTQIAFALGLGKNIVAVTRYDKKPDRVKTLPKVGGFLDIDMERLLSFNPSLVLLTEMHSPIKNQLKRVGVNSLELRTRSIKEVLNSITLLGNYGNHKKQAKEVVEKLKRSLVKKECENNPRVLVTLGRSRGSLRNLVGASKGTYLDEMVILAGGKNVLQSAAASYPRLSVEELVGLNPDVVLDIAENGFSRKPWKKVPFKKKPKIIILTDPQISSPGVHMDKILNIIHNSICKK
jgi:cobalamin transport system substrate-binding protein